MGALLRFKFLCIHILLLILVRHIASAWRWRNMGGAYFSSCRAKAGLPISYIDVNKERNERNHHTSKFHATGLTLRRGQPFILDIFPQQEFDTATHTFQLHLKTGSKPSEFERTKIVVKLREGINPEKWGMTILDKSRDKVTLKVNIPADTIVSTYRMTIEGGGELLYTHREPIYVLFNPWCEDDEVYMPNDEWLEEYILNDQGVLFQGTEHNILPLRWYFGQFDQVALQTAFEILRFTPFRGRDTAREVARRVSAKVNANDDGGIIVGNWNGDYTGGVEPWAWTGSPEILDIYMRTRRPVKYGQCWAFCGVTTTILRALGIPTRAISNFNSAHDTDKNCSYDRFYDEKGEFLKEMSGDSTWNFHCWNDSWMARPDLEEGYGGWQAVDATPQEKSKGLYQLGPAPLKAVKEGNVNIVYDTKFVFAEVNADVVYWKRKGPEAPFEPVNIERNKIGSVICTKAIGPKNWERIDITDDYKFKEGSVLEDIAVKRALRLSDNPIVRSNPTDVSFDLDVDKTIFVGEEVHVALNMKNRSSMTLNVEGTIGGHVVMYNGVSLDQFSSQHFQRKLDQYKSAIQVLNFANSTYQAYLRNSPMLRLHILCLVKETKQVFVSEATINIRRPDLKFGGLASSWHVGKPLSFYVTLRNPLSVTLTNCVLRVDGSLMEGRFTLHQRNILPGEILEMPVTIIPEFTGGRDIVAAFTSSELGGLRNGASIDIKERNR